MKTCMLKKKITNIKPLACLKYCVTPTNYYKSLNYPK